MSYSEKEIDSQRRKRLFDIPPMVGGNAQIGLQNRLRGMSLSVDRHAQILQFLLLGDQVFCGYRNECPPNVEIGTSPLPFGRV